MGNLLAAPGVSHVYLVDNSPEQNAGWDKLGAEYLYNKGRNLGYGRAHNIALRRSLEQGVPYHLVVNPDVELSPDVIPALERFMDAHPDVGHVMPRVVYPDGELQYLCKLLPTPADLLVRRFLPAGWTQRRMERFEMRASGYAEAGGAVRRTLLPVSGRHRPHAPHPRRVPHSVLPRRASGAPPCAGLLPQSEDAGRAPVEYGQVFQQMGLAARPGTEAGEPGMRGTPSFPVIPCLNYISNHRDTERYCSLIPVLRPKENTKRVYQNGI